MGKTRASEGEDLRPPFLMRAVVLAVVVASTLATAAANAARASMFQDDASRGTRPREIGRARAGLLWSYDRIGVVIADSDDPRSWSG